MKGDKLDELIVHKLTKPSYLMAEYKIAPKWLDGLIEAVWGAWWLGFIKDEDTFHIAILRWIAGMEQLGLKVEDV